MDYESEQDETREYTEMEKIDGDIVGASGPRGFPSFINPAGIDTGFIGLVISGVVAFVLALVAAMVIGTRKDEGGKALNISVD